MKKGILREIIPPLSIFGIIAGLSLLFIGAMWIWFPDFGFFSNFIKSLSYWNYYLFIIGILLFIASTWYFYDFLRRRKFLLEEIKTDKRSELIKIKKELEEMVKKLPSKYEKMLEEKKKELKIR